MAASGSSPLPEKMTPAPYPNLQCHHIATDSSFPQFQQHSAFDDFSSSSAAKKPTRQGERERSDSDYAKPFSLASRDSDRSFSRGSRHARHSSVRTLPSWIDSVEVAYGDDSNVTDRLLARPPPSISAQHHYAMDNVDRRMSKDGFVDTHPDVIKAANSVPERNIFGTAREPVRGRKWDHAREGDPVIVQSHGMGSSPWSTFVKASMYGPAIGEEGKTVDPDFLDELTPGYYQPWRGDAPGEDPEKALGLLHSKKKRLVWYQRAQRSILFHPLVPLAFRLTVLTTSTIALGLSASIFHLTRTTAFSQSPSAIMAIVVDVIALPYIGYITWDEYTGKPLGLRSPKVKVRLVLLDLFFIIFESANLSLAFQNLTDHDGVCHANPYEGPKAMDLNLCRQGKALAAILFIALLAWSLTFSVSIIRLVQRVGGREEKD